jgi:hypothetical protein
MKRQQDDMTSRMQRQEEELRRRQQENTLFMQVRQTEVTCKMASWILNCSLFSSGSTVKLSPRPARN